MNNDLKVLAEATERRTEGLLEKCWCGGSKGHTGRHRGANYASISHKTTEEHAIIMENGQIDTLREELAVELAKIRMQVEQLVKAPPKRGYEFWLDHEEMSHDFHDPNETAMLWGACVPEMVLDAVWYSLKAQSKADLLNAIAVAKYKDKPPKEVPKDGT